MIPGAPRNKSLFPVIDGGVNVEEAQHNLRAAMREASRTCDAAAAAVERADFAGAAALFENVADRISCRSATLDALSPEVRPEQMPAIRALVTNAGEAERMLRHRANALWCDVARIAAERGGLKS